MKHTKFFNKIVKFEDPAEIDAWIRKNLSISDVSIMAQLNYDGTIKKLEFNKSLSKADKDKLLAKFPELEGKEVE